MKHHDTGTEEIATLGGQTMGTTWSAKLVVSRGHDLHALHALVQARLDGVVAEMSNWEPDSDISRYNGAAARSWHRLPHGFGAVMRAALQVAELSGGAFDPTVGPLVALWGFGAGARRPAVPAAGEIGQARARSGWSRLRWRGEDELLQPGGVELDLSAIAKGYGVDVVQRALRERGIAGALVEVGGELYGYGRKPDGTPWRVLVESAPDEDIRSGLPPRVVNVDGIAIATSGDRWHRFESAGRRYSHTFDPRSGAPVAHAAAAVSVIAAEAMFADAWATAFTVLEPEQGLRLANAHGLAVRILARTPGGLHEHLSDAFGRHLDAVA